MTNPITPVKRSSRGYRRVQAASGDEHEDFADTRMRVALLECIRGVRQERHGPHSLQQRTASRWLQQQSGHCLEVRKESGRRVYDADEQGRRSEDQERQGRLSKPEWKDLRQDGEQSRMQLRDFVTV
jgi:hypothetical protein